MTTVATVMKDNVQVSYCKINCDNNCWTISEWFTNHDYLHQGYGKQAFKKAINQALHEHGMPDKIEYIWNGANDYVMDFLKKFSPVCKLPLSVRKYSDVDEWEGHIYILNVGKVFDYVRD